jgi:alpha-beta hydrolase superfamily lysophospholipase
MGFLDELAQRAAMVPAVLEQLADAGFTVYAADWHGHGRSEPTHDKQPCKRVLIIDRSHLIDDATLLLDSLAMPAAQRAGKDALPIFGVAHSMGAAILTLVEKSRPGTFAVRLCNGMWLLVLLYIDLGQWLAYTRRACLLYSHRHVSH